MNQVTTYNKSTLMPVSSILQEIPVLGSLATLVPESIMIVLNQFEVRKLWAFLFLNVVTQ